MEVKVSHIFLYRVGKLETSNEVVPEDSDHGGNQLYRASDNRVSSPDVMDQPAPKAKKSKSDKKKKEKKQKKNKEKKSKKKKSKPDE